ncbi:MAG: DUF2931 family protein [Psychrobacter sp.]
MFDNEIPVKWFTYIYAPRHFSAWLISGECFWYYTEDAGQGLGFSGDIGGGWRSTGLSTSGGSPPALVKLPLGVQLTWLSNTEKKYYQTRITLPRELILAEFAKRFEADVYERSKKAEYTAINFALAPGGYISLRLGGTRTTEIANFQAREIQMSWEFFALTHHFAPETYPEAEFMDDQYKKLPDAIKAMVKENTFPLTRWKNYSDKFNWYLTTQIEMEACRIWSINGNARFYTKEDIQKNGGIPQEYAPAWLRLEYKKSGIFYSLSIRFTEQKQGKAEQPDDDLRIYQEFKDFFSSNKLSTTIALVIEEEGNKIVAYLTDGSKKQYLTITQFFTVETNVKILQWFDTDK